MLRDLLSNRLFLGSFLVVFVLFLVGLHFWSQQVHRELRESEAETRRFIRQLEEEQAATVLSTEKMEGESQEEARFFLEPENLEDAPNPKITDELSITADIEFPLETEDEMSVSETSEEAAGESERSPNTTEIEETVQFINRQFAIAAEFYYERLEIRQRRRRVHLPNGLSYYTWPPGDKERLEEIQIEVYNALSPIGDLVPGAVEVELHQHPSGVWGCRKYFFPHIFEEVLGEVPEGYYQFDAALVPFVRPAIVR